MTNFYPHDPESQIRRESWRRLFADIIETARRATGQKIGQAARLAGMELTEWLAVETGYKRPDEFDLHSMAPVLAMSPAQMQWIVSLCEEAWPD